MDKRFKEFCKKHGIEILEYMGKTRWYMFDEKNYKRFLIIKEDNKHYAIIDYWMCRESRRIEYYGHNGVVIIQLYRPKSKYKKGMYKKSKNGRIKPSKNGHKISTNCWESIDYLGSCAKESFRYIPWWR